MEWNGMERGATHQQSDFVRVENHPANRRFWSEKTGDRLFPRTTSGLVQVYYRVGPQFVS